MSCLPFLLITVEQNSISLLKIYCFTFGTGYGRKHIGLSLYFNLKFTGSVLRVLIFPYNNALNFSNKLMNFSVDIMLDSGNDILLFYINILFVFIIYGHA